MMDWETYTYKDRLQNTLNTWMVKLGSAASVELNMHAESADKRVADLTRQLAEAQKEVEALREERELWYVSDEAGEIAGIYDSEKQANEILSMFSGDHIVNCAMYFPTPYKGGE